MNTANVCYQEKIMKAEANMDSDVSIVIETANRYRKREMSPAVLAGTKEMWYLAVALIINKLWSSSKCDANYRLCLRTQIHSCIFCEKCYSGDRLGEE